jgi:cytochrome c oxidase cbb3-type subunit I/II
VLSLSSYKDPLTGEPLAIPDADRAALNDLEMEAGTPAAAYVPGGGATAGEGEGGS